MACVDGAALLGKSDYDIWNIGSDPPWMPMVFGPSRASMKTPQMRFESGRYLLWILGVVGAVGR
jgi:hypothetical protein